MKRLIFILIFISFSSNALPQWLVDGGNLIWPYGDAKLSNGMLHSIKTTTGEIKDWYSGTPIQPIKAEHIVQYDTNRVGFAYGGYFNIIPRLTDDAYVDGNTNFWGERLSSIMGQFTINDACSVDISLASGISTYFNSWNYKHTLSNYSAFISDGFCGAQDSALVSNFYGYTSRLPLDLNATNYYGFYSREMFTSSYTPTLFYHFYGEGDHPSYFGGSVSSKYNIQIQSLEILGKASDITIDNTGYDLTLYKNDLDVSANSIYWDSTYNYIAINFSPVTYNFANYEPVPNSFIATADTGSGWFSVRCMINTETNPDTALTFTFYSFTDNTVFTESNLVKVSFPISVKLVLTNDAELGYQNLTTY